MAEVLHLTANGNAHDLDQDVTRTRSNAQEKNPPEIIQETAA